MPGWDYLPLNGLRFREWDQLQELFGSLADAGIRTVNLSFYGLAEHHDQWAGRRGDFDYLMRMAEVTADCGLNRSETLFLRKSTISDLPRLVEMLDGFPGLARRMIEPWDFRGRGTLVEDERPELRELNALPSHLREAVDTERYRTEASWIDAVLGGDIPGKTQRIYFVSVRDENVEYLESENCEAILGNLREHDQAGRRAEPSLTGLARRFGDPDSLKFYALRDLEWKWLSRYYREQGNGIVPDSLNRLRSRSRLR